MSKQTIMFLAAVVVLIGVALVAPKFGIEVSPMPVFEETNK